MISPQLIQYAFYDCHQHLQRIFGDDLPTISFSIASSEDKFPKTRNVAYTRFPNDNSSFEIVFAPKFHLYNDSMVLAVLRHELAHVIDEVYSTQSLGRFVGEDLERLYTERRVDRIAELLWNQQIFYDKVYLIQNVTSGVRPRPLNLPH
jgi:hypothetical protein